MKGEQWVQCESCQKWRLLPPYMMHLLQDDDPFTCNVRRPCPRPKVLAALAKRHRLEGHIDMEGHEDRCSDRDRDTADRQSKHTGTHPHPQSTVVCSVRPCPLQHNLAFNSSISPDLVGDGVGGSLSKA